ncbi:MAG TPA: hypothetical protein VFL92_04045, partial [Sphingomonas sp.]|nr:hypothetical protein [Sphingomonas sp.]
EGGFGGFGFFFFLLPMSWVMQMALCARDPRNRTERLTLYAMAAMTLALAFGGNVKVVFIQFIITLAVCILAFGIRIRPRVAAALALLAIGLVLYVQPIVQITRVKAAQLSPIERVNEAGATLAEADYNPARLLEKASEVARTYKLSYAGSYVYPATWNVDRFQMIFPIDEVARALPTVGTIGIGPTVTEIIEVTLPSVFIRKTNISTPDVIGWHFGFRTNGAITRPVVGLLASSLATYGLLGVALLPGLVILVGFSIINLMAGKMQGNPWAAFVFMNFLPIVEKEIAPFLVIYTHLLPYVLLTCAIMWMIWASRYRQAAIRINQFQGRRRHDAAPL